jgi:hypothetical protein
MSCKKNYLLITEDEKVYIKNLYGLLTEATTGDNEVLITADSTFAAGKYSQLSEEGITELTTGLENASNWLTTNKGSVIYVQVVASESQLTNYDYEQDPEVAVPPKFLSRQRAKTLTRYLKQYFKTLVDRKTINEMPIFETPKIDIGLTKYTKGQKITPALRAQYNTEQSVAVELKLMSPEKCLIDLEIEVKYDSTPNAAFPCRGGHNCNDAMFQINLNGVEIGIADLNNYISKRDPVNGTSKTSGVIKINETTAKAIIAVNKKKLIFSLKCLSSSNCHSGTPEIVIKKGGEVIYNDCSPAMERGDMNEYPVLELDSCGNVIKKGTGDATNNDETNNDTPTPIQPTIVKGRILTLPQDIDETKEYFVCGFWKNTDRLIINQNGIPVDLSDNCQLFIKKGGVPFLKFGKEKTLIDAIVGSKGLIYTDKAGNKKLMDVDPGTVISNVVNYGEPNANPITLKNPDGLMSGDDSGSGKYHVASEFGKYTQGFTLFFKPGPSPDVLEDEKSKNIIRFNLDDEAIQDFEGYYITNKLVEKTPDGMYKVIANKITYAAKTYVKGSILKLDQV